MSLRTTILKAIAVFALALAPALAAPPEGKIEINYHRCDGKYERWGVHLWKSPNMPLPDIDGSPSADERTRSRPVSMPMRTSAPAGPTAATATARAASAARCG